eukprot:9519011-Alexandrium_andersonii.AAC.1
MPPSERSWSPSARRGGSQPLRHRWSGSALPLSPRPSSARLPLCVSSRIALGMSPSPSLREFLRKLGLSDLSSRSR